MGRINRKPMNMKFKKLSGEGWLQALILLHIFFIPVAISPAQVLLFTAVAAGMFFLLREHRLAEIKSSSYFVPVLLFGLMIILSYFWSVRPSVTAHKFHRIIYYLGLFMTGLLLCPDRRGIRLAVWMFVSGSSVQAVWDLARAPFLVCVRGVNLYDTGNMRDPQLYLVSLILLAAFFMFGEVRGKNRICWAALVFNAAGLIIHFKRGVWISFFIALLLLVLLTRRWKALAAAALVAGSLVFVPQVQQRLAGLKDEFRTGQGGRMALWTEVAPALIREHPLGMGYGATRNEDFTPHTAYVQPKLTHVHNNALQIILELGWQGLAVWILWMGTALVTCGRLVRNPAVKERWVALGGLAALAGLLVNGMVEYNFGDSEILMAYCFLMGLSVLLRRSDAAPAAI